VGAVIAARRRNRIGWLFLAFGLDAALLTFANPYYVRGTVIAPGSLPPAAAILGSLGSVLWPSTYLFLGLLLLVFPDGRLPSPRWRPVALVYVTSWVLVMLNAVVAPATGSMHGISHTNPLAIQALGHPTWKAVIQGITAIAVVSLAVVALAPLVRFRRAGPVQRQQLKWFAFVVGGCIASELTAAAIVPVLPAVAGWLVAVASVGVVVGLPIAVGLAILRYRLYDIDRLISRALVYASLTVILGLCYGGLVLGLGQLFGRVGERTPSWAVAGATLAVAALFQPARHRIQAVVDRRFNRRKYNSALTIQAFSTRLRDQIDLDTLATELLAVVDQTMQPTRVSLWLRPSASGSSSTARSEARPTTWSY
jgi:MFS family permease